MSLQIVDRASRSRMKCCRAFVSCSSMCRRNHQFVCGSTTRRLRSLLRMDHSHQVMNMWLVGYRSNITVQINMGIHVFMRQTINQYCGSIYINLLLSSYLYSDPTATFGSGKAVESQNCLCYNRRVPLELLSSPATRPYSLFKQDTPLTLSPTPSMETFRLLIED